jgi:putative tricarboxylic transport membrane protein
VTADRPGPVQADRPVIRSAFTGRSELLVAVFLAVVAGIVLVDAAKLGATPTRGVVGPGALAFGIGIALAVCAVVLAVDVLRGGHGEAEGGEDVDLGHRSDWRTVLLLVAAFGVNIVLIERAGWVISGSLMFLGCTYALGSRHVIRDLFIAVALSLVTFYGFAIGLGVNLPAGALTGIL